MNNPEQDFDIPQMPAAPNEDPIAELLGVRVSEMNDEQLDQYVKEMRTVIEAPQSFRALLKKHGSVETKAKKTSKSVAKNIVMDLGL